MDGITAIIAGGGIGGLAAGIALAQHGCDVQVLEQAPALTEVGAGLQISPNGWHVLDALGVVPGIGDALFEPEAIEMRVGRSGGAVFRLPMRGYATGRWGAPYIHIHRADLVEALAARLEAVAPGALRLGCSVLSYTQDGPQVVVESDSAPAMRADLLVGADGIHSATRRQMQGPDAPRYTGNVAWRAVVPMKDLRLPVPPTACVWVGHKRHAVTTRIRGGAMANFVGMVEVPEPAEEGWRITGGAEDALADFSGWDPVITGVIEAAPVLHRWALFDRAPYARWSDGNVTLLGDAAHPMLPSMAQGAVQALEDAWVLAACVKASGSVAQALASYGTQRQGRTAWIQKGSAANARLFHHGSALGRWAVYGPMAVAARLAPALLHRRQDWVYRHNVTGT